MKISNRQDLTRLIKIEAVKKDMNIDGIGRIIGMASSNIHRAVNHSDMKISTLQSIADALGCDLDICFLPRSASASAPDRQRDI